MDELLGVGEPWRGGAFLFRLPEVPAEEPDAWTALTSAIRSRSRSSRASDTPSMMIW